VLKAVNDKDSIFVGPLQKAKTISYKFSKSVKAKEKLAEFGGCAVKTYCKTRWYSELHLVDSILENHNREGDPLAQTLTSMLWDEYLPSHLVKFFYWLYYFSKFS
jgi:hypothetical protein